MNLIKIHNKIVTDTTYKAKEKFVTKSVGLHVDYNGAMTYHESTHIFYKIELSNIYPFDKIHTYKIRIPISRIQLQGSRVYNTYAFKIYEAIHFENQISFETIDSSNQTQQILNAMNYDIEHHRDVISSKSSVYQEVVPQLEFIEFDIKELVNNALNNGRSSFTVRIEMRIVNNFPGDGALILYTPRSVNEPTIIIEFEDEGQSVSKDINDSIHFKDGSFGNVNLSTGEFTFELPKFSSSSNYTPITFGGQLGRSGEGLLGYRFKSIYEYDFIKVKDTITLINYNGDKICFRLAEIAPFSYGYLAYVDNQRWLLVEFSDKYDLYAGSNLITYVKHYNHWVIRMHSMHQQTHRVIHNWSSNGQYTLNTIETDQVDVVEENQKLKTLYFLNEKIHVENTYVSNRLTEFKVYLWDKSIVTSEEKILINHLKFTYEMVSNAYRVSEIHNLITQEKLKIFYTNTTTNIVQRIEHIDKLTYTRVYNFDLVKKKFIINDQFNRQTTGYLDARNHMTRVMDGKRFTVLHKDNNKSKYHSDNRYNYLKNADFKEIDVNGIPLNWQVFDLQNDRVIHNQTVNGIANQHAFEFKPGSNLKRMSQTVQVAGSKDDCFVASLWINGLIGSRMTLSMTFISDAASDYHLTKEIIPYDNGWQVFTFEFETNINYNNILLSINYDNQTHAILVHDVRVYKVNQEINEIIASNGNPVIEYNQYNSIDQVTYPSGDYIKFQYFPDGQPSRMESLSKGSKTIKEFNESGNVIKETFIDVKGRIKTQEYLYTPNTNLLSESINELGERTQYTYDRFNRLVDVVDPSGLGQYKAYDQLGRLSKLTKQLNHLKEDIRFKYTNTDKIQTISNVYKPMVEYGYTMYDLVNSIRIDNQILEKYKYETFINNHITDLVSEIQYGGLSSSNKHNYVYDEEGRLTDVFYNQNLESKYTYDDYGFLTKVQNHHIDMILNMDYDTRNHLSKIETMKNGVLDSKLSYQHTDLGVPKEKDVLIGTNLINYKYDKQDKINELDDKELKTSVYSSVAPIHYRKIYDDVGRIKSKTYNNLQQKYQYYEEDHKLNLTPTIETMIDGTQYIYSYDELGNLIFSVHIENENDILEMKSYVYDDFKRLVKESFYNNQNECLKSYTYAYDMDGNILEKSVEDHTGIVNRFVYTYSDSIKNRLSKITEFEGTVFKKESNLSYSTQTPFFPSSIDGEVITYKGREVSSYGNHLYTYNDQGIRIKKELYNLSTVYTLEGNKVIQSKYQDSATEDTVTIQYHYDESGQLFGLRYNEVDYIYQRDIFGSIMGIIDLEGKVFVSYTYNGFGEPCIDVQTEGMTLNDLVVASKLKDHNIYIYKGYIYDQDTKMYYLNSRYYHPSIGRFITPDDPSYLSVEHINGLNLYAYCGNNPVMYLDSTGTSPRWMSVLGTVIENFASGIGAILKWSLKHLPELSMSTAKKLARKGGHIQSARAYIRGRQKTILETSNLSKTFKNIAKWTGRAFLAFDIGSSILDNINSGSDSWVTDSIGDIIISVFIYALGTIPVVGWALSIGAAIGVDYLENNTTVISDFKNWLSELGNNLEIGWNEFWKLFGYNIGVV